MKVLVFLISSTLLLFISSAKGMERCGAECSFRLCRSNEFLAAMTVGSKVYLGVPAFAMQPFICRLNEENVRIKTGNPLIRQSDRTFVPLDKWNGTSRAFPSRFFRNRKIKGLNFSGITFKEPDNAAQWAALKDQCIKLPVLKANGRKLPPPAKGENCVSFRMKAPKMQVSAFWKSDDDIDMRVIEPDTEVAAWKSPSSNGRHLGNNNVDACGSVKIGKEIVVYDDEIDKGEFCVVLRMRKKCNKGTTTKYWITVAIDGKNITTVKGKTMVTKGDFRKLCFTPMASKPPSPSSSPTPSSRAVVLVGNNPNFTVTSCTSSSLNLQVNDSSEVQVGDFIWKTPRSSSEVCSSCNNVARKITSIVSSKSCGTSFCMTVETELAKVDDLFSSEAMKQFNLLEKSDEFVENAFDCGTSSTRTSLQSVVSRQVSAIPTTCSAWPRINPDGRCAFSNCIVGNDGNPNDCLFCKTSCNNGCGSEDFDVPDQIPLIFDFRESCCIHDHCYASSFSKEECDLAFLRDNLRSCADELSDILYYIPLPLKPLSGTSVIRCPLVATLYYLGVYLGGDDAHDDAKKSRIKHEMSDTCVARCPTTQRSGGQGTTTLPVDLMQSSGVFKVSYQMYTIKDRLDVFYEGKTIFTTGGLVSGGRTVSISYSGNTTVVQVRITAPNPGTAWDVSVECPELSMS